MHGYRRRGDVAVVLQYRLVMWGVWVAAAYGGATFSGALGLAAGIEPKRRLHLMKGAAGQRHGELDQLQLAYKRS